MILLNNIIKIVNLSKNFFEKGDQKKEFFDLYIYN